MTGTEADEVNRIRVLRSYEILDTAPEYAFDSVTATCAELLEVPIVLVTLIDANRQWFKSRVGLVPEQTERAISICDHAIRRDGAMIVEDLSQDIRFALNPLVVEEPRLRFYAGVPLNTPDGVKLGTLCAMDTQPRRLDTPQLGLLVGLAHQVEVELELRRQSLVLEHQLARCNSDRRQQEVFVAMVVHDMRSPLTAIALSAVAGLQQPALAQECLQEIAAAAELGQRLVSDVLDGCIARTGKLTPRRSRVPVRALLDRALAAVARSAADRHVELRLDSPEPSATCAVDPDMIGRALINLLENAVRFSPREEAVTLAVASDPAGIAFSVEDHGPGVPAEARLRVFEPFVSLEGSNQHRGLGLAFCKAAAEAHGGRAWVEDVHPRGSRLLLYMPSAAAPSPPDHKRSS